MTERFAVVGCGMAARHIHLPGLRAAGVEVTAFTSRSRASAESLRDEWGSGVVVEDWHDAVVRDDVDAVVVTTPNALHVDVVIAAAAAGKHVLVDKPIACTVADADEMIDAASANDVVLVPFQNTRFAPPFAAAHGVVAAGRIGSVTGVRAAFGHAGPQAWSPRGTWFFDRASAGGGCLIDLGVHVIDLVRFVTGHEIEEVAALLRGTAGDVETDAQLLLGLDGGVIGTAHASWSSPGPDHQLTVVGTEGTLHFDSRTPLTLQPLEGERERVALPASTGSPLDELLAAMRQQRQPSVTALDGRAAIAVVEAAYRSAAEHRLVSVA
ncbi:MAG TPA: Gfo/Idh/MocA family oxidoreductase [Acidimicrobiales bacterium]